MNIVPKSVFLNLIKITAILFIAHLASQIRLFDLGFVDNRNLWSIKLFDFGRESNLPTLFSSLLLR